MLQVGAKLVADLAGAHADLDVDTRVAQPANAFAPNTRVGIFDPDDHAPDSGRENRIDAW